MPDNDSNEEEILVEQVIMVDGKPTPVRDVIERIKKKARDGKQRDYAEG